jgi:GNAT superfamily N-acetyltransferase
MKIGCEIVEVDQPAWEIIGGGLTAFNTQQAGEDNGKNLCFVVKNLDGEIVGGVIGATYWDWLYINLMWIKEDLRDQGFGKQLLGLAEEKARQRGARHAYLDTFSFQAPDFYKKLGYEVFGELQDFPQGHQRYFMKKKL